MDNVIKICEKQFSGPDRKKAYLTACRWVTSNILAKANQVEVENVLWNITMAKDGLPACTLQVYIKLNEAKLVQERCKACKSFHSSFFINEKYDCNSCRQSGYRADIEKRLETSAAWYKRFIIG